MAQTQTESAEAISAQEPQPLSETASRGRIIAILIGVILGTLLAGLDQTVVGTALPRIVVSTVSTFVGQTRTPCSRRPDSVRLSQRSSRIPGSYRIRSCPREHAGWSVPPLDQQIAVPLSPVLKGTGLACQSSSGCPSDRLLLCDL